MISYPQHILWRLQWHNNILQINSISRQPLFRQPRSRPSAIPYCQREPGKPYGFSIRILLAAAGKASG